jgi:hypothetical protein
MNLMMLVMQMNLLIYFFSNKVNISTRQLHKIDDVIKYLQTKGLSLSEGCVELDGLIDGVASDKDNPQQPLY